MWTHMIGIKSSTAIVWQLYLASLMCMAFALICIVETNPMKES